MFNHIKCKIKSTLNKYRFVRFLLVGFGNSLFAFAVYSALIIIGLPVFSALLISALCGTIFNFFSTGGLVFRDLSAARFPRFIIAYLLLIWLNYECIDLLQKVVSSVITAQAIIVIPLAVLSYFVMAWFVFNKRTNTES